MWRRLNDSLDPYGRTVRGTYRLASIALLGTLIALIALTGNDRNMTLLPFLIGLPLYLSLLSLTARRLRDAGMSPYWAVWMLLGGHFGPKWFVTPDLVLQPSDALWLLPVAMGWCLATASTDEEKGFWFRLGRKLRLRPTSTSR
jgi:uncharacterized membrane protein YhaH (DUF805 family)